MPTISFRNLNLGSSLKGLGALTAKIYSGSSLAGSVSYTENPANSGRYVPSGTFTTTATAADYDGPIEDSSGGRWAGIDDFSTDASGNLIDSVSAIKAKTDLIGSATVTYTSPIAADGSAEIVQGDDYLGVRALSWTKTNYAGPTLAGATVQCAFIPETDYEANAAVVAALTVSGTVSTTTENDSSITALFTAPLTAAQTASLASNPPNDRCNYVAQVVALDASGHRQTDFLVSVTVRRKVLA